MVIVLAKTERMKPRGWKAKASCPFCGIGQHMQRFETDPKRARMLVTWDCCRRQSLVVTGLVQKARAHKRSKGLASGT